MVQRIRRSFLMVPLTREELVRKAPNLDADAIMYELDDGIGIQRENKLKGRENLSILPELDFGEKEICVRINSVDSEYWLEDLKKALDVGVHTIVLPKVNHPWHIHLAARLTELMSDNDDIEIIFTIERAPGYAQIEEICRVAGDYPNVTGIYPGFESIEVVGGNREAMKNTDYINLLTLRCAPLGDLDLYVAPDTELEDQDAMRTYSYRYKELGYKGQVVIHPDQLEVINDVFTPTEDEVEEAREMVEMYEEAGVGGVVHNGVFLDRPIVNIYKGRINRYNKVHGIDEEVELEHTEYTAEG